MFGSSKAKQRQSYNSDPSYRQADASTGDGKAFRFTKRLVSGSRFELKYLISETKAAQIEQYIKSYMHLDKYCKVQQRGFYPIVSLYLDTKNLHLCRESLTGVKNRFKLRIRSYTDNVEYPRYLEIKRRMNFIIIKSRSVVMHSDIPLFLADQDMPARSYMTGSEEMKQFQLYVKSLRVEPAILIRYMRQAYEDDFHNGLRITFDRELSYNVTNLSDIRMGGQGWQHCYSKNNVILEIKFTGHYPLWLSRMAKVFSLRQESVSKYVTTITESCSLYPIMDEMEKF